MSSIFQTLAATKQVVVGHSAGAFVVGFALIALIQTAIGLGRTRQWFVLPVACGLIALVGFLLNPFADSNTSIDLRTKLTSYETMTTLCIAQFILVAGSSALSLRMDGKTREGSASLWLSIVHAIPAPALVIGMLLVEQAHLAEFPGARPEPVGRQVGLLIAGLLLLVTLIAGVSPQNWLILPHQLLSAAILLACMFTPLLQDSLPQSMWSIETESLGHLWKVVLGAALIVAIGAWRHPLHSLQIIRER